MIICPISVCRLYNIPPILKSRQPPLTHWHSYNLPPTSPTEVTLLDRSILWPWGVLEFLAFSDSIVSWINKWKPIKTRGKDGYYRFVWELVLLKQTSFSLLWACMTDNIMYFKKYLLSVRYYTLLFLCSYINKTGTCGGWDRLRCQNKDWQIPATSTARRQWDTPYCLIHTLISFSNHRGKKQRRRKRRWMMGCHFGRRL